MKNVRQVLLGIVIAIVSIGLIIGVFSLSLSEGLFSASSPSPQSPTQTSSPTVQPILTSVESLTPSPSLTFTFTLTSSWTPTLPPTSTNCPPPVGWLPHLVQTGETLAGIAAHFHTNAANLQLANCLTTTDLIPGTYIYVPALPTQTPVPCGRPYGWVVYIVQPGDTLYHLSLVYGVTVAGLQQANCMGNSTALHVGQVLYVPPRAIPSPSPTYPVILSPTSTPVYIPTSTPTYTPEVTLPTDTPTEISPTNTATEPPIPTATDTPPEIPTDTSTPTSP